MVDVVRGIHVGDTPANTAPAAADTLLSVKAADGTLQQVPLGAAGLKAIYADITTVAGVATWTFPTGSFTAEPDVKYEVFDTSGQILTHKITAISKDAVTVTVKATTLLILSAPPATQVVIKFRAQAKS